MKQEFWIFIVILIVLIIIGFHKLIAPKPEYYPVIVQPIEKIKEIQLPNPIVVPESPKGKG